MHNSFFNKFCSRRGMPASVCLLAVWTVGVGAGYLFFRDSGQVYVSVMCGASRSAVSIVLLAAGLLLPFLITAYAAYINKLCILYFICFAKAFGYCMAVLAVYGTYGGAGWLMHGLLLFTQNVSVCLLICVWLRMLSGREGCMALLLRSGLTVLAVCVLDMVLVFPFVELL